MTTNDGNSDGGGDDEWSSPERPPQTRVEEIEALHELQEAAPEGNEDDREHERSDDSAAAPTLVGVTVADRYHIRRQIARGGMGLIYLATQEKLEREVVVKVLPPKLVEDDLARKRFEREAKGLSNLQHPNVVTVHDFGLHEGVPYIVMEHLEGENLSQRLYRVSRLPIQPFLSIVGQILDALAEAHAEGVIHRDLKPENVMLCERRKTDDFVKLLDFGLAKLAYKDKGITNEDDVVGTVSYMAPEYILGEGIDTRADVYSLAVLLYVMLSGRKPYDAEDRVQVLYAHVHQKPTPLQEVLPADHEVPTGLIDLIHQCMAKDPDDRPRDANELLHWMLDHVSHSKLHIPADSGTLTPEPRQVPSDIVDATDPRRDERSSEQTVEAMPPASAQTTPEADERDDSGGSLVAPALIGLVVATGVIGFVATRTTGSGASSTRGVTSDPSTATATAGDGDSARGEAPDYARRIDEIRARIDAGKFEEAQKRLDELNRQQIDSLETLERLSNLRKRLTTERLLNRATSRADAGEPQRAMALYERVLAVDTDNDRARRALKALRGSKGAPDAARETDEIVRRRVQLESTPSGTVFLDGDEVGTTPLDLHPAVGSHEIEIRADGYESWSRTIRLDEAARESFDVTLEKTASPSPTADAGDSSSDAPSSRAKEGSANETTGNEGPDKDSPPSPAKPPPSNEPGPSNSRPERPNGGSPDESTRIGEGSTDGAGDQSDEDSEETSTYRLGGDDEESSEEESDESFRVE